MLEVEPRSRPFACHAEHSKGNTVATRALRLKHAYGKLGRIVHRSRADGCSGTSCCSRVQFEIDSAFVWKTQDAMDIERRTAQ
jgi:hypothetical protein